MSHSFTKVCKPFCPDKAVIYAGVLSCDIPLRSLSLVLQLNIYFTSRVHLFKQNSDYEIEHYQSPPLLFPSWSLLPPQRHYYPNSQHYRLILPMFEFLGQWNHTVCTLLCLASLAPQYICEHPCCLFHVIIHSHCCYRIQ